MDMYFPSYCKEKKGFAKGSLLAPTSQAAPASNRRSRNPLLTTGEGQLHQGCIPSYKASSPPASFVLSYKKGIVFFLRNSRVYKGMDLPRITLPRKPVHLPFDPEMEFFQFFKILERAYDTVFLLESLGDNSYDSRYAVIGFDPLHMLKARGREFFLDGKSYRVENPYEALRSFLPRNILSSNYAGGLVGYLGYEAMNYFEPTVELKEHSSFDPFLFGFYDDGVIHDTFTGEMFYFYYERNRLEELRKLARQGVPEERSLSIRPLGPSRTEAEHRAMVEETIEEIKSGNTFQCQIGFQVRYEVKGDSLPIYETLRKVNPSPHMFYLKFEGEKKLIGASPELLFRLRQGEMESFPLAGTTRRGSSEEEDRELVRVLLNDPKERAEHNMLIDLHRNDIGRVARFGTVKVRRRFDIKKFSHVQHISSEVVGIIRNDEDMFSGLARSFPAGTLSGAPKIESIKIIQRVEQDPRGPYGGAVGHFGVNGDCIFAIPIRSFFVSGEQGFARASGGIVYDSRPEAEYQEVQNKLASVVKSLEMLQGDRS